MAFFLRDAHPLQPQNAPPQEFVKLVSAEGAEFWVDRKCAMVSGTIKAMLSGERAQEPTATVPASLDVFQNPAWYFSGLSRRL